MLLRFMSLALIGITSIGSVYADDFEVKGDGFILPKFIGASGALNSYANQNETAPTTSAISSGSNGLNSFSRSTWQIGQSRFGLNMKYGPQVTGKVEVDFFNNNTASPSFSLLAPRLRLAKITFKASDQLEIVMGQDWDIFHGAVNPYTYNLIGGYWQAGNVGFIRQQITLKAGGPTGMNFSVSLGMPQKNDNSATGLPVTDGLQELNLVPTFATNLTYKQDDKSWFGMAAIVGRVLYTASTNDAHLAYGFTLFDIQRIDSIELRTKAYFGQNLNNINMLTLASGAGTQGAGNAFDFVEYGGFTTGRIAISDNTGLFLGLGFASITNSGNIPSSITSNILTSNLKASGGLDHLLAKNLKIYGEFSFFNSSYYEGTTTHSGPNRYSSSMIDLGMKLDL